MSNFMSVYTSCKTKDCGVSPVFEPASQTQLVGPEEEGLCTSVICFETICLPLAVCNILEDDILRVIHTDRQHMSCTDQIRTRIPECNLFGLVKTACQLDLLQTPFNVRFPHNVQVDLCLRVVRSNQQTICVENDIDIVAMSGVNGVKIV